MATLSVCCVVKNEARDLGRGLDSLRGLWDELIIVDTGSTDGTVEIARKYTERVYFFKWIEDFAAAQNYAYARATGDYILKWDGDFVLDSGSREALLGAKQNDFYEANLLSVNWHIEYHATGQPSKTVPRNLLSRNRDFTWEFPVHARLTPHPETTTVRQHLSSVNIHHAKDKTRKKSRYSQTARILQNYLQEHPKNAYLRFFEAEGYLFAKDYFRALDSWTRYLADAERAEEFWYRQVQALDKLVYTYLCLGDAEQGLMVWNKYTASHPKWRELPLLVLARGDLATVLGEGDAAGWYEKYLRGRTQPGPHVQDYVRDQVHPHRMLAALRSRNKNL